MDNKSLMKIIHANDKEKEVLEGFINKFGYKALMNFLDLGFPVAALNQKTKQALFLVSHVLDGTPDNLICLSKLTEIPLKSLLDFMISSTDVKNILEHPEKFDLDTRQTFRFRCMNDVYVSYQKDTAHMRMQQRVSANKMSTEEIENECDS